MNTVLSSSNDTGNDVKITLTYPTTRIDYWLKYDSRSSKEKALIMFIGGHKRDNICKLLNISNKQLRLWIISYYVRMLRDKKAKKLNSIYKKPNNYSEWTSSIIYNFWSQIRDNQKINPNF
jgi:hypothetical protein